jgi:dipeptidyl-peptidase-3
MLSRRIAPLALAPLASLCATCAADGYDHPVPDTPPGVTYLNSLEEAVAVEEANAPGADGTRVYQLERIDDVGVIQLYADGFADLPLKDKILAYHLSRAAIAGRDIHYMQKCEQGVVIRETLEEILVNSERVVEPSTVVPIRKYLKLFWLNNGPYHYTTSRKFLMETSEARLARAAEQAQANGAVLPLADGESPTDLIARIAPVLFDPEFEPMVTDKNPQDGSDPLVASAVTYYGEGVTLADLEGFEEAYELNSTLRKDDSGKLYEEVWRAGNEGLDSDVPPGLYAEQIEEVILHLENAMEFAPEKTRKALELLVKFYRTGEREDRVAYDTAWVQDSDSSIDTINGFIEVYLDPRGVKGAWEALVSYEDPKKAELIKKIADNAQWFEDHMPFPDEYKKKEVQGISARSIDVIVETGDSGPITPIGINLPNDNWVREHVGSKSVSLANVIEGYAKGGPSTQAEFCWSEAEIERSDRLGSLVGDLLTNMHEVIGHASGRMSDELSGTDPATVLKEYYSALEEARSDLVGLYFMMDPKLSELGLLDDPNEAALAAYERYVRNANLMQLRRIKEGNQIEEDHMRNRHLVSRWIQDNSSAVEERVRDGKTYYVVTDTAGFREAAGRLLTICQTLKSKGDYEGVKALFDPYITFDPALRDQVLERYAGLNAPSYSGFVMPRLTAIIKGERVVGVHISYPMSLEQQMLEWSGRRVADVEDLLR